MDPTWTFERAGERLILQRCTSPDLALVILSDDTARRVPFEDVAALIVFESDMQAFLVRTGWTLTEFTPERRGYTERRTFPRREVDRRRWWTDGDTASAPGPRAAKK